MPRTFAISEWFGVHKVAMILNESKNTALFSHILKIGVKKLEI